MDPPMIPVATAPSQQRCLKSSASDFGLGCSLEASATTYSSPDLLSLHDKQVVLSRPSAFPRLTYGSFGVEHPSATQANYLTGAGWRWAEAISTAVASNCSPPSIPGLLAVGYDPLTEFENELSPLPLHDTGDCLLDCTAPRHSYHLLHDVRSTGSCEPRSPAWNFLRQWKQGDRLIEVSDGPCPNAAAKSTAGTLRAAYGAPFFPVSPSSRSHESAFSVPEWKGRGYGNISFPFMGQSKMTASLHFAVSPTRLPRSRRVSRKRTAKEDASFQCSVEGCGKFFSRSYNFKSHMETHDEQREYPFPCLVSGCAKKFVRKTDLQRHHYSVHKKERNHRCDYCGRQFARKDTLRKHMEDGCSKRFDIETLDLSAETHGALNSSGRELRPGPRRMALAAKTLPPTSASQASSSDIVRISEANLRARDCQR